MAPCRGSVTISTTRQQDLIPQPSRPGEEVPRADLVVGSNTDGYPLTTTAPGCFAAYASAAALLVFEIVNPPGSFTTYFSRFALHGHAIVHHLLLVQFHPERGG